MLLTVWMLSSVWFVKKCLYSLFILDLAAFVEFVSCFRLPTRTLRVLCPHALNVSCVVSTRVQLLEEVGLPRGQESHQSRFPRAQGASGCGGFLERVCQCL